MIAALLLGAGWLFGADSTDAGAQTLTVTASTLGGLLLGVVTTAMRYSADKARMSEQIRVLEAEHSKDRQAAVELGRKLDEVKDGLQDVKERLVAVETAVRGGLDR